MQAHVTNFLRGFGIGLIACGALFLYGAFLDTHPSLWVAMPFVLFPFVLVLIPWCRDHLLNLKTTIIPSWGDVGRWSMTRRWLANAFLLGYFVSACVLLYSSVLMKIVTYR